MARREDTIWFPGKLYGFGWGLPLCWQGWAVIVGYFALLFGAARVLLPDERLLFAASVVVLTAGLIAICLARGERPRWRWGRR